ncbi:MAG: response regulator transcription factor [Pseudonocardiaceae bacterium]
MARILIAEDDELVASFLERGLRAKGMSTFVVGDGELAERLSLSDAFDLLILDLGLPRRAGFPLLQELRARGKRLPVIVLTGQPERWGAVDCLEGGADDYMTKPFAFSELLARVRLRLREPATVEAFVLSVGAVRLDLRTRRATVDGHEVELTGREFAMLEMFLRHGDQVLSRAQLLAHVWGYHHDPDTNLVGMYISVLRRKLGPSVIETVRGAGYRFSGRPATAAAS